MTVLYVNACMLLIGYIFFFFFLRVLIFIFISQMVIQSGEVPSVLQQLCNLPWKYFSEPRLTAVLFPTLLACCLDNPDNMVILQQEMSFQVSNDNKLQF